MTRPDLALQDKREKWGMFCLTLMSLTELLTSAGSLSYAACGPGTAVPEYVPTSPDSRRGRALTF